MSHDETDIKGDGQINHEENEKRESDRRKEDFKIFDISAELNHDFDEDEQDTTDFEDFDIYEELKDSTLKMNLKSRRSIANLNEIINYEEKEAGEDNQETKDSKISVILRSPIR